NASCLAEANERILSHPDSPVGWGDWCIPALSIADSHLNRGSGSSAACALTYELSCGTKHSRTARTPASLGAMSAQPYAAGNGVCSSPTVLAPNANLSSLTSAGTGTSIWRLVRRLFYHCRR